MDLAHLIHRIAVEPQFAVFFRNHPIEALRESGIALETDSIKALAHILENPRLVNALLTDSATGPQGPEDWAVVSFPFRKSSVGSP